MRNSLTNEQVLFYVLGWQRGGIEEIASALLVSVETIENANEETMKELCVVAQKVSKMP